MRETQIQRRLLPSSQMQPKLQRKENLGVFFYPIFIFLILFFQFIHGEEQAHNILGRKTTCKSQFSLSTFQRPNSGP